jgi:FkbM family methyltransferase
VRRLLRRTPAPPRLGLRDLLHEFALIHPSATFAEIGANDGRQHDHLQPYLFEGRWRGVMVEPVPYVFERLQRNYAGVEGVALENAAITDHDGEVPFFHLVDATDAERAQLPDWYDGIGSLDKGFLLKHAKHMPDIADRIVERTVPALTFESLIVKHELFELDLLVVDVEGADWHVLRGIDLDAWQPVLVIYEHFHLTPADREAARAHLDSAGYATREEGFDTVGLRSDARQELHDAFRHVGRQVPGVYVEDERP